MIDSCGRVVNYVRISLTDRCNYRCVYCMPNGGVDWLSHEEIMRYEDVHFLLGELEKAGVRKVRFTGGEPLVRKGIIQFLREVKQNHNLKIALTTNGALLEDFADELKQIGIDGVNISLDTLDAEKFCEITRGGQLEKVLRGIYKATETGIPLKVNMVLMLGFNDGEIQNMLDFAHERGILLRLIEFMPLDGDVWSENKFISSEDVLKKLSGQWQKISREKKFAHEKNLPSGPARYYENSQTGQTIGIISAVSSHYCESCNRLRVTANGKLRPCLFSNFSLDILPALRARDADSVRQNFEEALRIKPKIGVEQGRNEQRHMVQIGG